MRQICIIVWPCQQAKTSRSTSRELVKSRISIFICGEIQMQSEEAGRLLTLRQGRGAAAASRACPL
jgi:hypothetical protein